MKAVPPRLLGLDLAPTGRAKCVFCKCAIAKGGKRAVILRCIGPLKRRVFAHARCYVKPS